MLVWFWALLSSMSQAQQRALLRFWTALPCLPAGGLAELPRRLAIVRANYTSQKYPQVACLLAWPARWPLLRLGRRQGSWDTWAHSTAQHSTVCVEQVC